jgi:hypothetical protein
MTVPSIRLSGLFVVTIVLSTCLFAAEEASWAYDKDPGHLWNRLHHALFVRTASDGRGFSHQIDPMFWQTTRHLLTEPSHQRAIAVLDEFISSHGENLIRDPVKRALLQRDSWALFDWASQVPDDWTRLRKFEPAARALRERLAILIKRLALNADEIKALQDNYAKAIEAHVFQGAYGNGPFLPPDLFKPDGPWVNFSNTQTSVAMTHTRAFDGRSVFLVFLNLPGGRKTTEAFIKELGDNAKQLPVGTQVALVRRALVIDSKEEIVATPITETVQIRVFLKMPDANNDPHVRRGGQQDVFEFALDRAKLFSGEAGGLVPVDKDARGFNFLPGVNGAEGFEQYKDRPPPDPIKEMRHTMSDCLGCHGVGGVESLLSVQNSMKSLYELRSQETPRFKAYSLETQFTSTIYWKEQRYEWGLLKGWLESQK